MQGFIFEQERLYREKYKRNYDMYISNHPILKDTENAWSENNKLIVPMPRLLVDEYAGYFGGNMPKVQLDNESDNEALQEWIKHVNFDDEHSEVVKAVAIYGRSYLLAYQDEEAKPNIAHVEPDEGFMIYDDTIKCEPLAFVRYTFKDYATITGTIYYANEYVEFTGTSLSEPIPYVWHTVPAVEFYANEERQGVFDGVKTLVDALDRAMSRKADQVDYFDNAYMKVLGINLEDENGNIAIDRENRLIYSPDSDATSSDIGFISKPDADGMQENLINRLIDQIYYTSMIPNLQDDAFSGNASGVALKFKLLPMQNMASFQERKFIKALRNLFKALFTSADGGQIVRPVNQDSWNALRFTYTRNMPTNLADEAQTASTLSGLVSQETMLSTLSMVDDPKNEINRMRKEEDEQVKQRLALSPSAPDFLKSEGD